ncbi:MAG: DUF5050 domain-containing protein [Bacillota bacterium]|nr:DUF5050 domain-containing protein [Bacillota bacterium]
MKFTKKVKTFVLLMTCTLCAVILSSCGKKLDHTLDYTTEDYVQADLSAAKGTDISSQDIFKGILSDGWVYYSNLADKQKLTKIKTDGSGKTTLTPDNRCSVIGIQDGYIYFNDGGDSFYGIYKMKTDGKDKTKIIGGSKDYETKGFYLKDEWVYYTDDGVNDYSIFRVKLDGSNKTRLNKGSYNHIIGNGDYIYYIDIQSRSLCRMKLDGSDKTTLYNHNTADFQVCGDYIYVLNAIKDASEGTHEGDGNLYRIKLDGSDKQLIKNNLIQNFSISGDWLCYNQLSSTDNNHELVAEKLDGSDKTSFGNKGNLSEVLIAGNYLYYRGVNTDAHKFVRNNIHK